MDYTRLRAAALKDGEDEEAVTVDTRALIDKVLARYSGEWTTLRELIQNAADAQATTVKIKWETLPSTQVALPTTTSQSEILKHAISHHTLRRLVVQNNGQPFSGKDWARLKRIAEGNPDETKIGAFGVGFYSVFADCEEPFVSSGNEAMAFYWKGNALFTRKTQFPPGQGGLDTAFVLDYRNTTTPLPNLLSVGQFLATSLTFVALENIEFWIDDWKILSLQKKSSPSIEIKIPRDLETRTKEGLMKLSAADQTSTQLDAKFMSVLGWKPQATPSSTKPSDAFFSSTSATEMPSLRNFFSRLTAGPSQGGLRSKAAKEEKAVQEAIAEDLTAVSTSSIFLRVTSSQIQTNIPPSFAAELERATKKPPPKTTKIAILTSSHDETMASENSMTSSQAAKAVDVFSSVLPSKKPGGRIFIGFPTTQTTGGGMHISAPSVIPTVEREAIDLNARWVRSWNMEMLRVAGIMSRLAFANEMSDLNDKLRRMSESGDKKGPAISTVDIEKCVPEALHILKTYTFADSTPSGHVAQIIEEAFWTAFKRANIEVYSSRGVLPSSRVRSSSDEIGKFVGGIPVVMKEMKDSPFIKKIIDFGLVKDITVDDICEELGNKAMDKDQLCHFIKWAAKGAVSGELDYASKKRVLDIAVGTVSDGGESGEIIAMGSIKNYLNNRIPASLPIPPTTLPLVFTANIPEVQLQALGWQPLGIVPWLRFLVESGPNKDDEQNLTKSAEFSSRVLVVLSKNWDNLSPSSKTSVISTLEHISAIPTKMGMRKPGESFFPTVKLFGDLPTVQNLQGVKDKFLTALGVRKTVDLDTIFTRLLNPSAASSEAVHKRWSHMELIKYLASVKDDIPTADMEKLIKSQLCPAEAGPLGMESTKGTEQLFKVSQLFEPRDSLRALKLPILQWPGPPGSFRPRSAEGQFLFSLGLRPYPSVDDLVDMMASSDLAIQGAARKYFIANYQMNSYDNFDLSRNNKDFLPVEGNGKQLVSPSACYTNEKAAVFGYNVLLKELLPHASKFGVARDPPITGCVEKLIAEPPQNRNQAIEFFEYFTTRLGDLGYSDILKLRDAPIVPVSRAKDHSLRGSDGVNTTGVNVRPSNCYLGSSMTYGNIFDFVDLGTAGNAFLYKCGAKSEPTKIEIAKLACSEPARLLGIMQSSEKYLNLLRSLADELQALKADKALFKQMRTSAWLLGSRELSSTKDGKPGLNEEEEAPIKQYQLAAASHIVVLDDYISYRLFKQSLLCAPEEDALEAFYIALGSETLGSKVEEDVSIGPHTEKQDGAQWLRKHVLERSKLFLYEYSKYKRDAIKHDDKWLEKNLKVEAVRAVALRRSLRAYGQSHTETRSAASFQNGSSWILYVAAQSKPDMYQVGQAICQLLLTRPSQQAYLFFEPFLKLDLLDLRARGYNVDRILRAKAAEARIAEEERRKALEAEQRAIRERESEWTRQGQAAEAAAARENPKTPEHRMPGAFNESPEQESAVELNRQKQPKRGLFSNLTRRLGFDTDDDSQSQKQLENFLPPEESGTAKQRGLESGYADRGAKDDGRVTSPAVVQQNLLNAIKSTRAHDSSGLFSPPQQSQVKEQATYCDSTPATNIDFAAEGPGGMRIFVAKNLSVDTMSFLKSNAASIPDFEILLKELGGIYGLQLKSLHIFYDEHGSTIAFNSNGSIFCNLRFFNQLHAEKFGGVSASGEGRVEAAVWWWVVIAHELAHNLVAPHNSEHSYYTESFIHQYFSKMVALAMTWSKPTNSSAAATPRSPSMSTSARQQSLPPPPPYSSK
ncbi:hypothetical protein B0T26DRAFT_639455 [Lasiosphaeria miniovina]|uniref:Sacsin/Nov domain-containing protein n=1 Tax=Lasiosphaeria miniovina TaxID=1954250 RepID=A0AA40B447_9PEZI|nr:uncharacterized protein B0T26DRAFT_639455 [Lasiosphaeria miniovina]KAK0727346.1 hypothetical protein B0T26DRAFT_639455 [Lasiosphaeria miniovina]